MLDGYRHRRIPLVRKTPCQHFIEYHAGGIDIGPGVYPASPRLLWRDIVDRPQRLLSHGILSGGHEPGDPKISHLHTAVLEDHDIVRLDIPMDDPPAVGVGKPLHDLDDIVKGLLPLQLPTPSEHQLLQSDPLDQFHNDIIRLRLILGTGHVINGDDIGVGQHGNGLGFLPKPAAELLIMGQIFLQDLDGHIPVEPVALGLVYHSHTTGADPL